MRTLNDNEYFVRVNAADALGKIGERAVPALVDAYRSNSIRLDVIRVTVPPLRERPEDIPPLIDHFIAHWNQEFGRSVKGPSGEALELMLAYRWPGNVRELKNVLERAILLESDESILPQHLPIELVSAGGSGPRVLETRLHAEGGVTTLAQAERIAIEMALAKASGRLKSER